ncbi:MAG: Mur ligase family protein [Candidatus Saccharimonas sp.]
MFESFFLKKMQSRVMEYFAAHPSVKVVAIAGSIGKATTRRALAQVLSQGMRVRMHEDHRKTPSAIPTEILGITMPEKPGFFDWIAALKAAKQRIRTEPDTDVIIQEINTTKPGDLAQIGSYLQPDITLLTGVTAEQIDAFGTLQALGQEYMSITAFSKFTLINRDDTDVAFVQFESNPNFSTYGTTGAAEYRFEIEEFSLPDGYKGSFMCPTREPLPGTTKVIGEHMVRAVIGAYATAILAGMSDEHIILGAAAVTPLPGRMNPLKGIDGTTIIDDSHDARPASVAAALQTLYALDTQNVPQRIAVLGDIQNLGILAKDEHEKLGALCDPSLVTWFVLIGKDMEMYAGPVARGRGCQVHLARNAIEAGEFVRSVTETGAVILVTGSASFYLEETVKILCDMNEDNQLVRQTPELSAKKNAYFSLFR